MNYKIFITISLITLLFFSACTQQPTETEAEEPTDFLQEEPGLEFETSPTLRPLMLGQSHSSGKVKVTVSSARKSASYTYLPETEEEIEEDLELENEIGELEEELGAESETTAEETELEEAFIEGESEEVLETEPLTPITVFPETNPSFPLEENEFYLIEVSIKNITEEDIYAGAESFSLLAEDGHRFDSTIFQDTSKSIGVNSKIEPNEEITGTVLFEVPKSFSNWKLQYRFGLPVYWKLS